MKKILKKFTNNTGSMTVEASLIFPIIFLTMVALIYICIFLYQNAYLKSLTNHVAERGAASWGNTSKMKIGTDSCRLETGELKGARELLNRDLYWRITGAGKDDKIEKLKGYALHRLKENNILESEISRLDFNDIKNNKDKINIWVKDYIVYKEVNVVIKDSYDIPIGKSLKVFGLGDKYNVQAHGRAVINDPMEFIRNVDFIGDTLKEYETTGKALGSFQDTMNKIKENIDRFFENKGGKGD